MSDVIRFSDFEPGTYIGQSTQIYTSGLAESWQRIFGKTFSESSARAEAASLATVMMMRSFLEVVAPRPPGNIHARQEFFLSSLPRSGEAITTEILCENKVMKRERRYVDLLAKGQGDDGREVYAGRITLIWAE